MVGPAMTNTGQNQPPDPRFAGWMLLLMTVAHMAAFQITSAVSGGGSFQDRSAQIGAAENLYRAALLLYVVSSVAGIGFGVAVFALVRRVSMVGAALSVALRLTESGIALVAWTIRFAMVENMTVLTTPAAQSAEAMHSVLRSLANAAFDISSLCLGLATVATFELLRRARLLPGLLCVLGTLGGVVALGSAGISLTLPHLPVDAPIAFAVLLLTQLVSGAWLIFDPSRHHLSLSRS
jgi:Domain of unknown function (DUF4386)